MLLRSVSTSSPGTCRPAFPYQITCIGEIAFDAVKMSMDPRGLGAAIVLHNAIRPIP
jgi:hypothetical protein